jgi:hypothetical protein
MSLNGGVGTGDYTVQVYSPDAANGNLTTFVWGIKVTSGNVDRVTLTNFKGYSTDVYQDGSGINAIGVDVSPAGTLGFDFPLLFTGDVTSKFIVRTNAQSWTTGKIFFIDGGVASSASFAPAVPLPPAVWAGLSLMGLMGIKGYRRQRLIKAGE